MRAHAHVEDHIRRVKDSGLCRFPFTSFDPKQAWLAAVCFAGDLVRWFQLLCLTGQLARAEPKTLRWRLWHAPARLVRHPDKTSSASSTAGPTRRPSSPPTPASPRSPDPDQNPGHPPGTSGTNAPPHRVRPAPRPAPSVTDTAQPPTAHEITPASPTKSTDPPPLNSREPSGLIAAPSDAPMFCQRCFRRCWREPVNVATARHKRVDPITGIRSLTGRYEVAVSRRW
jgi:hypothetical protein